MKKISRHDTSPRDSSPLRFNRDGNHQYATVCDSVHRDVTHRDVLNRDSVHHDGTKSDVTFMKFDPPNYHQPQNITKFDSGGCTAIHVDVTSQYREAILKRDISPRKKHENSPKKLRRKREKTRRSVSPGPSSSSSPSPSPSPSSSSCCCCSSSFYPAPFLPSGSLPSILSTASPCPSPPYQSSSCGPLSPKSPHHRHRSPARANQSPPPNLASLAEGLINLKEKHNQEMQQLYQKMHEQEKKLLLQEIQMGEMRAQISSLRNLISHPPPSSVSNHSCRCSSSSNSTSSNNSTSAYSSGFSSSGTQSGSSPFSSSSPTQ